MTKVWDGPTPWDTVNIEFAPNFSAEGIRKDMQAVYRAAMNSPEVRALYERLKLLDSDEWDGDLDKVAAVLAAYEVGLREGNTP